MEKRLASMPNALVTVFGIFNEVVERWSGKPIETGEPLVDLTDSVFWPLVLFLLARRWC